MVFLFWLVPSEIDIRIHAIVVLASIYLVEIEVKIRYFTKHNIENM